MKLYPSLSNGLLAAALAALPLAASCASFGVEPAYAQQPAEQQEIVVHIGDFTNDLHSVFMGMSLATNLAKKGADVTIFLDREGVRLGDKRERGDLTWGDSGAVSVAMDEFVAAGGTVLLCPHCASLAGVESANARPGTRIATHDEVAHLFLDADKVIDF